MPTGTAEVPGSTRFGGEPLAVIALSAAPIVLEGRYRLLVGGLVRLRRSPSGRWALAVGYSGIAVALAFLAARHFATTSWPLSSAEPSVLAAAGLLLLFASALKALAWGRLLRPDERPPPLALAAGNGGASLAGLVLPARLDDAIRIAVVRRYRPCPAGVRALALSLVMLGLIDSAALAPIAFVGVAFLDAGTGVRAGLALVALGGVAAAAVIVALPRLVASRRARRFRLGRWLTPRTTSLQSAVEALALVSACWLARAVALFLLLGTLGVGFSFPLTLLFLCAGAAASALPIGPAGTATQVGAHTAALISSGVGASQALTVSLAVGVVGVLCGTLILLGAIVWNTGRSLAATRAVA